MHQRIYTFLETHNILCPSQFGFRIKHSTSHAVINITEEIKHSIDNNKYGCGFFLDPKRLLTQLIMGSLLRNLNTMESEELY